MSKEEVTLVLRATLEVMARLVDQTRTQADNLIVSILKANDKKLADAIFTLIQDPQQPPTPDRVAAALAHVGIRVS